MTTMKWNLKMMTPPKMVTMYPSSVYTLQQNHFTLDINDTINPGIPLKYYTIEPKEGVILIFLTVVPQ